MTCPSTRSQRLPRSPATHDLRHGLGSSSSAPEITDGHHESGPQDARLAQRGCRLDRIFSELEIISRSQFQAVAFGPA